MDFFDNFQRADTSPGSLGAAPDGTVWDCRGPYVSGFPLPPATAGQISGSKFIAAPGSIVYAIAHLPKVVRSVEAVVRWDNSSAHAGLQTGAILISPSANLIDQMRHITFTHTQLLVQKRIGGGAFQTIAQLDYPWGLLDGEAHTLRISHSGNYVTASMDSMGVTMRDDDNASVLGNAFCIENYSTTTDVYPLQYLSAGAAS